MINNFPSESDSIRSEIAAAAARMIAEDGTDYGTAKRKAAQQILGDAKIRGDFLPDNAQVEEEVRIYNALFFAETQPARLLHLRQLATQIMLELAAFNPYLTGAVLNGTAGEHADIHLQLFADSPKDVEIYLLNQGIQFETSETRHFKGASRMVETVSFMWRNEGVHLALYEVDDLRGALKPVASTGRSDRANIDSVYALIAESESE